MRNSTTMFWPAMFWKRAAAAVAALAGLIAPRPALALISGPYTADANTTYLYHLNEAVGASSAANAGSAATAAVAFNGTPFAGDGVDQPTDSTLFGFAGFTGYGTAIDLSAVNSQGLGVDVSANGAFQIDDGAPASNDRLLDHSTIFGAGNAFTLEALVRVPAITGSNREIIATDSGAANDARGFQFRIGTAGVLEFNFIGVNTGTQTVAIPTTGDHAFVANEWFHAALSYNGTSAQFYWTRMAPQFIVANAIGAPVAEGVDLNDDALLTIGNEGRAVGTTGATEGLLGQIDEVRISNVARNATQFMFTSGLPAGDVNGDFQVNITDFTIITANLLKTPAVRAEGDLDGNNIVDFADFRTWKLNKTSPPGDVTIPEPAGATLAAVCAAGLLGLRRRRLRRTGATAGLSSSGRRALTPHCWQASSGTH